MPEAEAAALAGADDLRLLLDVAAEAGRIASKYFKKSPEVWMKGGTSPVSEADYAVDRYMRETLVAARPDYGWLSEETADSPLRLSARRTFVVDPIDGTRAFLEGRSTWCVSVAVVEAGVSIAGVLECPAKHETFAALPGQGATMNGQSIRVRATGPRAQVAGAKPLVDALPAPWRDRVERVSYIPSLAYRLAMIANGTLDGTFVKPNAHDWDLAAADLILREAGGTILTRDGSSPLYAGATVSHGILVAGSGPLLGVLAETAAAFEG